MVVASQVALLHAVDDSEVHADGTSLLVLKNARTLVLVPLLHRAVGMLGKGILTGVGLAILHHPVQTVERTVVVSIAGLPVVDNHVVLQVVVPDDGVFQRATRLDLTIQIDRGIRQLVPTIIESVAAHPNAATTVNHHKRAVLTLCKRTVGEACFTVVTSNERTAAQVEVVGACLPGVAQGSRLVVAQFLNMIDDVGVASLVELRIMTGADIADVGVWPPYVVAHDMVDARCTRPGHVPFGGRWPSCHVHMVLAVAALHNVPAPIGALRVFNAIVLPAAQGAFPCAEILRIGVFAGRGTPVSCRSCHAALHWLQQIHELASGLRRVNDLFYNLCSYTCDYCHKKC